MSEEAIIIEGVNCPKTRWIYRGIAGLASLVWLTRLTLVSFLWPSWSIWGEETKDASESFLVVPFGYLACMVVESFFVPVPVPVRTAHREWSVLVAISMAGMLGVSQFCHTVEWCMYWISVSAAYYAARLLLRPEKDVRVQQVVYVDFEVCLVGYLGYNQRPVWLACAFVAALILVNALRFEGLLRLDQFKTPEEEEKKVASV